MPNHATTPDDVDLERIARWFAESMPSFSAEERQLGAEVYRQLRAAEPIPLERLAQAMGWSTEKVKQILDKCAPYDEQGRVDSFWGLTLNPTRHRLQVEGRTLYSYCAWDTLFVPALLGGGGVALIESECPQTGAAIRLTVRPEGISNVDPAEAVVSFLTPDLSEVMESFEKAECVDERKRMRDTAIASFCHYIFFFESAEAAARWSQEHPETFVLSLERAFELGKKTNALVFDGMQARG